MNWDAIAAVAELIAAVGVIASLIYLATQIRQNTRSTRAAAFQGAITEGGHIYRMIAENSEAAQIFRNGLVEPDKLTNDELFRFLMMLSSSFRGYENFFAQHLYGTADDTSWEAWVESIRSLLRSPGVALFWKTRGNVFRKDFQAFVAAEAPADFPEPGAGDPFGPAA